ncbi:MAG: ABC transporter ATP-binding protein [Phycisphaerae bacterium]
MPAFRRVMGYLRPHLRPLIIGLVAAVGVSVFYTFSVSSVVPVLKVIFADHETLADWIHRVETQRRLGVVIAADVPDDPAGLVINHVRPNSPNAGELHAGERIAGVGDERSGSYAVLQRVTVCGAERLEGVRIQPEDGDARMVTLRLAPRKWYSGSLEAIANALPAGKSPADRLNTLALVMGGLVIVSILGGACRLVNEGLVAAAVQRAIHDLRVQMADHVLRLPLTWHSNHPHGDVLGRFANDVAKVEVGLSTLFGKVIREPLKAVGVLALTLMIDWQLLLAALLALPFGAVLIHFFGRLVKRAQRRASQSWGRLLDHLGERLAGIRVVKAYNMEGAESRRFELEDRNLTRAQTHIEIVDAATNPALETIAVIAVAGFILYGGLRVFNGEIEPHLFFTAVICLGGVFDPVRKMGNVNNRIQAAEAAAQRVFELIDLRIEESRERAAAPTRMAFERAIEFRGVSFAYPSNVRRAVLSDVDLTVEKGQVVALVGPNGCGKTTLVSLLLRFFEPTAGRILIDDQPIAEVPLETLRNLIGLVTQDAIIFSGTVRENIAYGANGVAPEVVERAARMAHIEDFVRELRVEDNGHTSLGYDAQINQRTLSGGQRQRIALARAILRDPPILVLDEATSQIDTESERRIQEAMDDVMRGRTTFVIAHRFSTIARADTIVVLNEGRVVAVGRHDELLTTSPFYVSLCETQFAPGA